jgi:predicted RNA-binding Zn-ribbon protein involved in translation (DUF1610 family)
MAKQDKHYIEPKDIRGLRFDCKKCGSSQYRSVFLSLDPPLPNLNFDVASSLTKCPECGETWFNITAVRDQHRDNINLFVKYLLSLEVDPTMKMSVYLEIAPDPARCDKDASAAAEKGKKSGTK